MTTVAASSSSSTADPLVAMMMEETNNNDDNDMEMDVMSIHSFCKDYEDNKDCVTDCEEIVDLLLNPFDEEVDEVNDNHLMTTTDNNDATMMMMESNDDSQVGRLRQVSTGSKSATTTANNNNHNNLTMTPDAVVVSSTNHETSSLALTHRPPIPLYLSCNPDHLNEYQVEIRKMIQLFEASDLHVKNQRIKGRNRAIVLGQVGVQCSFCGHVFPTQRAKGSTYFPQKLAGIYQACQILSTTHLMESCPHITVEQKQQLKHKQEVSKASRTAGKDYWASTAEALGVYEDEYGLRFAQQIPTYDEMKAKKRAKGDAREHDNFKY